jgi:hypothetical protein
MIGTTTDTPSEILREGLAEEVGVLDLAEEVGVLEADTENSKQVGARIKQPKNIDLSQNCRITPITKGTTITAHSSFSMTPME